MKYLSSRSLRLVAGVVFLVGLTGTAEALEGEAPAVAAQKIESSSRNAHLTVEDRALVDEVSAWFNTVVTLKGLFDQQNQDGTLVGGEFYLRRPGRMRFEYAEPQQLTLLSDGLWVALNDRELESVDRYPLRETPLWLILKKHVDLAVDADIVRVERQGALVGVTVREEEGAAAGVLTLVFAAPRLDLRHWIVEDVQGNRTIVSLRRMEQGMSLSPELFIVEDYDYGFEDD